MAEGCRLRAAVGHAATERSCRLSDGQVRSPQKRQRLWRAAKRLSGCNDGIRPEELRSLARAQIRRRADPADGVQIPKCRLAVGRLLIGSACQGTGDVVRTRHRRDDRSSLCVGRRQDGTEGAAQRRREHRQCRGDSRVLDHTRNSASGRSEPSRVPGCEDQAGAGAGSSCFFRAVAVTTRFRPASFAS